MNLLMRLHTSHLTHCADSWSGTHVLLSVLLISEEEEHEGGGGGGGEEEEEEGEKGIGVEDGGGQGREHVPPEIQENIFRAIIM